MQTQMPVSKIAKQSDCSKTSCLKVFGGHITGAPVPAQIRGSHFPFPESRVEGSQTHSHPHMISEISAIFFVGRTTSLDKENVSQKPSNPKSVFCPTQPHQCRGARHNRIAGIVHMRTPTTRKNHRHSRVKGKKSQLFFFFRT